jgi:serine/threonine-protein kinase SRPK3
MNFDICLGDWGVSSWTTKHLSELIQPITLRSPEVLIGAPWDWTTDWWNLGAVILEVFRGIQMFTGMENQNSPYVVQNHLKEIVDFFGPFPRSLLDQGASDIVREMFSKDGTIKDSEPLQRPGLLSDVYLDGLPQETREEFVAFLHALMKIDPKERLPTMDLLMQPWIRYRR